MSLASTLLKYLFIHRTAKIPWSEIVISRTPSPHQRPFWDPATAASHGSDRRRPGAARAVEFNVSHQAGLVALAGCATDTPPSTVLTTTAATTPPDGDVLESSNSSSSSPRDDDGKPGPGLGRDPDGSPPLLGIDITCPFEPSRGTSNRITTPSQFNEWVDIFAEVFSVAEVEDMKSYVPPRSLPVGEAAGIAAKLRYFYTFWALKEAYIKMTGEALLAGWLRELEFRDVRVPAVAEEGRWGEVESGVQVWMQGRRIEGLRVEVVGFGREYIVALVGRGWMETGMEVETGR
ncbi:hypothetical protein GJ744_009366 [Endocarpon pusillum]|uniref:holo-[acyl-carrier-protein] synthase n=1 Tax=Endocarpon pusillum TaxID=364733 RepID=A0A8H7E4L0_9EURO|nr:hypothetical protein GJ744_009366 [Endocarpon pusillum]